MPTGPKGEKRPADVNARDRAGRLGVAANAVSDARGVARGGGHGGRFSPLGPVGVPTFYLGEYPSRLQLSPQQRFREFL